MDERARKRRLFVGIALDAQTQARCAAVAAQLRATGFAARYESAEKLHVTLAFLGNVDASQAEPLGVALAEAARGQAPFELTLDKLAAFPHERRPRVVYIGAREQGEAFRRLSAAVRAQYSALGFEFAGDAVAHVTIARVKDHPRPLRPIEFAPIAFTVSAVTLFDSIFDPQQRTTRYAAAATAAL